LDKPVAVGRGASPVALWGIRQLSGSARVPWGSERRDRGPGERATTRRGERGARDPKLCGRAPSGETDRPRPYRLRSRKKVRPFALALALSRRALPVPPDAARHDTRRVSGFVQPPGNHAELRGTLQSGGIRDSRRQWESKLCWLWRGFFGGRVRHVESRWSLYAYWWRRSWALPCPAVLRRSAG